MKHIRKFGTFKINEEVPGYKSQYVEVSGEITKEKFIVLKTIDTLRDNGIELKDASGELTDGADIWVSSSLRVSHSNGSTPICLMPDYRKKVIMIESLKVPHQDYGVVKFSTPEQMANEIENILNTL
jgi:hypothetical protein